MKHAIPKKPLACLLALGCAVAPAAFAQTDSDAGLKALEKALKPLEGLTISGYVDPTYMYNRAQDTAGFAFLDKSAPYTYYESTQGDVMLDINKKFSNGSWVDITLMPARGYGAGSNNPINTAEFSVPLTGKLSFVGGQLAAWDGYEGEFSNAMPTITHNLLYDFSEPGFFDGVGLVYTTGAFTLQGLIANQPNTTGITNGGTKAPSFEYRISYAPTGSLSTGLYGVVGKRSDNHGGNTSFTFNDIDATYTAGKVTLSGQMDYMQQKDAAYNGGYLRYYGVSALGTYAFTDWFSGTLRYDYLHDSNNGGGTLDDGLDGTASDTLNGFGPDAATGTGPGANRQEFTVALDYMPTWMKQLTFKVEYRHDFASTAVFAKSDGSYTKNNDIVGTQVVYSF